MITLVEDLIIPKGTTFNCVDGMTREFHEGNYEAILATSKDTVMSVGIDSMVVHDRPELFDIEKI